jgi:hypothetical protein
MTTTPLDLNAIEARANAATPAPWGFYIGSNDNTGSLAAGLQMTSPGSYTRTRDIAEFDADTYYSGLDDELDDDAAEEQAQAQMAADVTFVAAARTDVPDLAAEIRQLRADLDDAKAKIAAALAIPNRDGMGGPSEHHHDTGYNAALWDVLLAITNTTAQPS